MHTQPNAFEVFKLILGSPIEGTKYVLSKGISVFTAMALLLLGFSAVSLFALAVISQMYVLSTKTILFTAKIGFIGTLFSITLGLLAFLSARVSAEAKLSSLYSLFGIASGAMVVLVVFLLGLLLGFKDALIDNFVDGPLKLSPAVLLLLLVLLYFVLFIVHLVYAAMVNYGIRSSISGYLAPLIFLAAIYIMLGFQSLIIHGF